MFLLLKTEMSVIRADFVGKSSVARKRHKVRLELQQEAWVNHRHLSLVVGCGRGGRMYHLV